MCWPPSAPLAFVTASDWQRAWSIYLVNLVFWAGLAVTGPAIAGMMQLTEARWSPSVRRLAVTTIGFLPVAFVLLVVLYAGRAVLYPWVLHPIPVKAPWLNVPFFFGRNLVLAAGAVRHLLCVRAGAAAGRGAARRRARAGASGNRLAVVVLMLWLVTVSLWGFDLVMSLDPIWYSGLFGGYFAVSALYTAFCLLSILTIRANARGVASIPPAAVQDVAKLQFAMSIMWMYFFWSQYLVIWYGNVPVETRFFVRRFFAQPWQHAGLGRVRGGLADPVRLPAQAPDRPAAPAARAAVRRRRVRAGGHLPRAGAGGRVPSVSPTAPMPVGLRDVAITVGFLALFALTRRWFMGRYKPVLNLPHTGH